MKALLAAAAGLVFGAALLAAPAHAQPDTARAAQHASPTHVTPHAVANENATPPGEAAPPEHVVQTVYVITFRPGPAWVAGVPIAQQALANHNTYWTFQTHGQGKAIAEGLYSDVDGAMALVVAGSLSEARTMAGADPAVRTHLLLADVHAWTPLIRGPREVPR